MIVQMMFFQGKILMKVLLKLFVLALLLGSHTRAQVAIIANPSVNADSLNVSQLRDIYSLNTRQWGDGRQIVPVILQGNEAAMRAFHRFIGITPLEMRKLWMRIQLSGEGKAPLALNSDEDIVAKVASTPGAIGIVNGRSDTAKVKTLLIIP
jgi:hypothetical protein